MNAYSCVVLCVASVGLVVADVHAGLGYVIGVCHGVKGTLAYAALGLVVTPGQLAHWTFYNAPSGLVVGPVCQIIGALHQTSPCCVLGEVAYLALSHATLGNGVGVDIGGCGTGLDAFMS